MILNFSAFNGSGLLFETSSINEKHNRVVLGNLMEKRNNGRNEKTQENLKYRNKRTRPTTNRYRRKNNVIFSFRT